MSEQHKGPSSFEMQHAMHSGQDNIQSGGHIQSHQAGGKMFPIGEEPIHPALSSNMDHEAGIFSAFNDGKGALGSNPFESVEGLGPVQNIGGSLTGVKEGVVGLSPGSAAGNLGFKTQTGMTDLSFKDGGGTASQSH